MKLKEIREMPKEERKETLKSLKDELLKQKGSVEMGGSASNPGKIKALKRTIARINTIEREEEI
ncbi:MAG TPA: 50S ribosomal protein L29 [Thermoplasmata archaeon]|jgi:large subunit ribosomal protein L29|nr:50S ribosomal protein L29 [Thermoplasmata archaeon]HIH97942.1 50S ribosomal protein L29 [Thermoplasmata archaeon]